MVAAVAALLDANGPQAGCRYGISDSAGGVLDDRGVRSQNRSRAPTPYPTIGGRLKLSFLRMTDFEVFVDHMLEEDAAVHRTPASLPIRLNVFSKNTPIKQYHGNNGVLRTETTINSTYDFGVGKRLSNGNVRLWSSHVVYRPVRPFREIRPRTAA